MLRFVKSMAACLVVVVALVVNAASGTSAPGKTGGHFVSEAPFGHTILQASESGEHGTELVAFSGQVRFHCNEAAYDATLTASTVISVTFVPTYNGCEFTIGESTESATVSTNGCAYTVTIGEEATEDNTVHLSCPVSKRLELKSAGCELSLSPQTPSGGISYKTIIKNEKHAITSDVTLEEIQIQNHSKGACKGLPTNGTGSLTGSVSAAGYTQVMEPVNITATGLTEHPKINSEAVHTGFSGLQTTASKYAFDAPVGTVECSTTWMLGTVIPKAVREVTLGLLYAGCKSGERTVTAQVNGCAYVIKLTGTGNDASVTLECPAGKVIETTVDSFPGGCVVTIGPQATGGVVDLKGEGSGSTRDLLLTWTLEGIKYSRDGCEGGGEGSNGTYTGSVTLKGFTTSEGQAGIWVE